MLQKQGIEEISGRHIQILQQAIDASRVQKDPQGA
jgi:hypothetical protein